MILKKIELPIIIVLYVSLLVGFFLNEDAIGGAYKDYETLKYLTEYFSTDFKKTLLEYETYGQRHSPFLFILKSFLFNLDDLFQRIILLHLFLISIIFFYKSLEIVFNKTDKQKLILFSCLFFLLPTFRGYSIWPDPHMLGSFFLIISIYFYLKCFHSVNSKKIKYALFNVFFLALSSYASPNFALFSIFFFYEFIKVFKFSKNLILVIILNLLLAAPFLIYILISDNNFIFNNQNWDMGDNFFSITNISNKIILILSIIFFFLIPLLLNTKFPFDINFFKKKKLLILIFTILFIFISSKFNFEPIYNLTNSGGGILYNLSNKIFNTNFILYFFSYLSLLILIRFSNIDTKNFILTLILILSHPQTTLWQANFSPTIFLMIYLLYNFNLENKFFNQTCLFIHYIFYITYLLVSIFKNQILLLF